MSHDLAFCALEEKKKNQSSAQPAFPTHLQTQEKHVLDALSSRVGKRESYSSIVTLWPFLLYQVLQNQNAKSSKSLTSCSKGQWTACVYLQDFCNTDNQRKRETITQSQPMPQIPCASIHSNTTMRQQRCCTVMLSSPHPRRDAYGGHTHECFPTSVTSNVIENSLAGVFVAKIALRRCILGLLSLTN